MTETLLSLLYHGDEPELAREEPNCFHELALDQLAEAINAGREEYELLPWLYTPLGDPAAIRYRQQAYADVSRPDLRGAATAFCSVMRRTREVLTLTGRLHSPLQKQFWQLSALRGYQAAVHELAAALGGAEPSSPGFQRLTRWLKQYISSDDFAAAERDAESTRAGLDTIRYTVRIDGLKVTVRRFEGEPDYGAEVEETFARFQQGEVDSHRVEFPEHAELNHVEDQILQLVARLHPNEFAALDACVHAHTQAFPHPALTRIERELRFFLAYLQFTEPILRAGLPLCAPEVGRLNVTSVYDLLLAANSADGGDDVVGNDVRLDDGEQVIVISGANQGGKTTLARAIGQVHWLAALGLPVPAAQASVPPFDHLLTHFEKEETVTTRRSRLEDELIRARELVQTATEHSLVILNEPFSSATLHDAVTLASAILRRLIARRASTICVSFLDELTQLDDSVVSMVAEVDPDDPAKRTYRLVRRAADGLAYAMALAQKYGLTRERLRERIGA